MPSKPPALAKSPPDVLPPLGSQPASIWPKQPEVCGALASSFAMSTPTLISVGLDALRVVHPGDLDRDDEVAAALAERMFHAASKALNDNVICTPVAIQHESIANLFDKAQRAASDALTLYLSQAAGLIELNDLLASCTIGNGIVVAPEHRAQLLKGEVPAWKARSDLP